MKIDMQGTNSIFGNLWSVREEKIGRTTLMKQITNFNMQRGSQTNSRNKKEKKKFWSVPIMNILLSCLVPQLLFFINEGNKCNSGRTTLCHRLKDTNYWMLYLSKCGGSTLLRAWQTMVGKAEVKKRVSRVESHSCKAFLRLFQGIGTGSLCHYFSLYVHMALITKKLPIWLLSNGWQKSLQKQYCYSRKVFLNGY